VTRRSDGNKEQVPQTAAASSENQSSSGAVVRSIEISYSGPLPHPDVLRRFEEIVPGSAAQIIDQFQAQSAHRREMESVVISANAFSQRLGSISASILALIAIGGGLWLAHEGKSVSGISTIIATLGGLVTTFLYKKQSQDKERAKKRER
jgi:uncharacterized membrane protein